MPYRRNYPRSVAEVLNQNATFKPDALRAIRAFARSKPWRGTWIERGDKFAELHRQLCAVYGLKTLLCRDGLDRNVSSGESYYKFAEDRIELCGRLSVVTYLHEFAHARGFDERQACRWSINLFRRCFPHSFARCRHVGHMLIREGS